MIETELSPIHSLPSGLCEDPCGEAAALIGRMAKDDPAALVELHGRWSPVLLGISCRMLGDRREAEDVVQDTFVRMWQHSADYDPHRSPPFVWAYVLMRGFCSDRLRSRHRSKRNASPVAPVDLLTPPEKSQNPRVMALDDFRRVRTALDQLAPDERSSLESAVFLEFSHLETSELHGTSLGTVKNHLRQSLKTLRNHLSRYEL